MQTSPLLSAYQRVRRWRMAMLIIFFTVFAATVLWAIPWLPYGLSVADYNHRLTFLLLLALAAAVSAFGAVYMREASRRMEQAVATWTTVHAGLGDLRRREYFYDRIVNECQLAASHRGEFTVVALRLDARRSLVLEAAKIARALASLEPVVREQDCLAALGPHEIGVLALRVGSERAAEFTDQLKTFIAAESPEMRVLAGWAVYPRDADEAGALVGVARKRLLERPAGEPAETRSQANAA